MNPKRKPRIVVVDDEPFFLELIQMILETHFKEFTLLTFSKPAEAIAELARSEPDLFITDTCMVGMWADGVLRLLAERRVNYPVIVMTAGAPSDEALMEAAGPDLKVSLIWKSFTVEGFLGLVEDGLNGRAPRIVK